jgi:hypothetical protein
MSIDIDWTIVLVKTPIARYLSKYDGINLSLTNKRIRIKLNPIIFNDIIIDSEVLSSHSNYFDQNKYYKFNNLTYMERLKLVKKYGLNMDLAFKEVRIDPFIEEANSMLSSASVYCESLTFCLLERPCYFLFTIFDNYLNLTKLNLCWCSIPCFNFINLLSKLEKLEILVMENIDLILRKSEDSNLARNLKFPISLKELNYLYVSLGITNSFQLRPREIIRNPKLGYCTKNLEITPQILPNLKYFKFYHYGRCTGKIEEFMGLNPNVEYTNNYSLRNSERL